MKKYKVLKYFQWGRLKLDKGQIIVISDYHEYDDDRVLVSVEHYPEKNQPVALGAVEGMVLLKKIEEY